ncbi:DUF1592 domain-containing protein [Limnoglobus roseus]|uniref:Cytochrome c domain-containing protein n=1 Tax=Limnoglobus roseus TaxID=2598579 RepID=A0A5C1A8Z7_9BACT|nr:DUF1592 domain-containing protein [Limnoglobus roseus]QEL15005.1 hypothetical protein PX52LOC_01910 [Limnoglobus roseus]
MTLRLVAIVILLVAGVSGRADTPKGVATFVEAHCVTCHDATAKKGRLDLTALAYRPDDAVNRAAWVKVFDRVAAGEMPPKARTQPDAGERTAFTAALGDSLTAAERGRAARDGRAVARRLNRTEYEYAVRDLLGSPWLQVKDFLPEDGIAHHFNKSAAALDVSHVQVARYLEAADYALRQAVGPAARPDAGPTRFYAREQTTFTRKFAFSAFNQAPERATFPTLGYAGQPDVRSGKAPVTVGKADPTTRELEGVGLPCGAYEPVEPKFNQFKAPTAGRYKLRFNAHAVWIGPNGHQPNKPPVWNVPDLDTISKGRRSEPVTVYGETPPHQLRRLGAFDATLDAAVHELDVYLLAGETIRPDASRLFRSRPGDVRWINPLAEKDGQPGVVYRWLEVEGPLYDQWPPAGNRVLFGDGNETDPAKLLADFARRAYRRPVSDAEAVRFLPLIQKERDAGRPLREAVLTGYTAVLCSPEFLTTHETPGKLDDHAVAARLALFLGNSAPDAELRGLAAAGKLRDPAVLRAQTERLLNDPKATRFVAAFLDYWLDLRHLSVNSPDATLYADYNLDDLLTESALFETQAFFTELIRGDLPARNLVASDFVTVNERLAVHYGIPGVEGVQIRKVPLPPGSVRGGLLAQASVLAVTANGTTTSPVLRGAWVMDRVLGKPSPPPPPVPAVEPDLRGLTTIREQLAKHRDQASCAACHKNIDPPGFALESFDVMGGFRDRYRATAGPKDDRAPGRGKNGQPFGHKFGPKVDASGELPDGRRFADVNEFKKLLLADEEQIARNLVQQLVVSATGAPVGFADRAEVEAILKRTAAGGYGVRGLIHAVVQSDLFLTK